MSGLSDAERAAMRQEWSLECRQAGLDHLSESFKKPSVLNPRDDAILPFVENNSMPDPIEALVSTVDATSITPDLERKLAFLNGEGVDAVAHTGNGKFDAHLIGVASVLKAWGCDQSVVSFILIFYIFFFETYLWAIGLTSQVDAGLFHSIYGTEGFQGFSLPLSHRAELAELIGPKAERLAWIFCMLDRATLDATLYEWQQLSPAARAAAASGASAPPTFYARSELGAFPIALTSHQEWIDFQTLSLADWLEQVEGASTKLVPRPVEDGVLWPKGEAWAYRREAYAAMARILGDAGVAAAPKMHAEVYGREPEWSRAIHQPLTPAMSPAAVAAAEAIASATCDFGS